MLLAIVRPVSAGYAEDRRGTDAEKQPPDDDRAVCEAS